VPVYERCLAVLERTVPPDHPAVATCLHNVAVALGQTGQDADADAAARRAAAIDARRGSAGGGVNGVPDGTGGAPLPPGASSESQFDA
jgi:hypothetical protein